MRKSSAQFIDIINQKACPAVAQRHREKVRSPQSGITPICHHDTSTINLRQAKCSLDGASAESGASDSNQKGIIGKWKDVGLRILDCIEATCWGGEEFAILLPHTPVDNAVEFAERVRQTIANLVFPRQIRTTVSIGAGEFTMTETEQAFFERVDQALYRAKRNGRNCVVADADAA
ncbi:GGDEF domain-containing protein [Methylomonas sp. EFPC3]|uniref:GGDEF domain-containing protein n=1 Tax=Methylomonas sp. EFPC3 TaxID=3021710 RepID=UPI002417EE44|nr:GGDEF domain-containing protein [Methylomonas sp. EFPC3]WFP50612.1 GGDEF domain-containing protein [Methylomonas sp. EFPC3]